MEIPGKVAGHLTELADLDEAERHALRRGRTFRRGQGYSLHLTALLEVHHALLPGAPEIDTEGASSADRKTYRVYRDRLGLAITLAALPPDSRPGLPDLTKYDDLLRQPVTP